MKSVRIILIVLAVFFLLPTISKAQLPKVDEAKLKEIRQKKYEFDYNTTVQAYIDHGNRHPKWDDKVIEALKLLVIHRENKPDRSGDEYERSHKLMRELFNELKCGDPFVFYCYMLEQTEFNPQDKTIFIGFIRAAYHIKDYDYPPIRQFYALNRIWNYSCKNCKIENFYFEDFIKEVPGLLHENVLLIAQDNNIPNEEKAKVFGQLLNQAWRNKQIDYRGYCDQLIEDMRGSGVDESIVLMFSGSAWHGYAWKTRGEKSSDKIKNTKWRLIAERVDKARIDFEKSWELGNQNSVIADNLIRVHLLTGDRDEMEKWFEISIKLDPDNIRAYEAKLNWLEPKWHGRGPEMINFGYECFQQGNWSANVPYLLIDALENMSRYSPEKYHPYPQKSFFSENKEKLWPVIQGVFEGYLDKYPKDYLWRSRYAKHAFWAKEFKIAAEQFEQLNGYGRAKVFGGYRQMSEIKKEVMQYK